MEGSRVSNTLVIRGDIYTPRLAKNFIKQGWIAIRDGKIFKVGTEELPANIKESKPRVIDASEKIIAPGFINCHSHLYSTLARGIGLPVSQPRNFLERLEGLWWRLDRALTYEDCYWSALIGSLLSLKAGVTCILDHHSSPYSIDKSLDAVAGGMVDAGMRGSVCYEVSDRDGQDRASLGIYENLRFADQVNKASSPIKSMMGLHASFTLSQPTLLRARDAAKEAGLGFHLHVAEDACDVRDSLKRYRRRVVTRLLESGILSKKTLAVHCVHVTDSEISMLAKTGTNVVACPRSNLSNAVGIAPVVKMFRHGVRLGVGSDGFGFNILDDASAGLMCWRFSERTPAAGSTEVEIMLLKNNALIASSLLDVKLGEIAEGYAADIIILSSESPTPVTRTNFWSHLLAGSFSVDTVIVGGRVVVEDGRSTLVDEERAFAKARKLAQELWRRV